MLTSIVLEGSTAPIFLADAANLGVLFVRVTPSAIEADPNAETGPSSPTPINAAKKSLAFFIVASQIVV